MIPTEADLFQTVDATWPAFATHKKGVWTLREGRGAGQRVSAASTNDVASVADIDQASAAMREMGQNPLFMVRGVQPELDGILDDLGYEIVDPVDLLMARSSNLAEYDQPSLRVIFNSEPLAIQAEIWREGEIDLARLEVMKRADDPKTFLFSRQDNRPAGTGFIACHYNIAMVHAVEVLPSARRLGVAEAMMRGAAWWAEQKGVGWFSCLATSENVPAQSLYRKMGMEVAAQYHYRKWIA